MKKPALHFGLVLLLPRSSFVVSWLFAALLIFAAGPGRAQSHPDPTAGSRNRPDRLEEFRDLGFGLFIHWGVDSQLGSVISHSLVGADEDYVQRYITELPKTFNPRKFAPADWAVLAKLAGVRYVVLTAKHHSGFCLWPTATTDFSIAHTPFKRDITREVLDAFREQGIRPGLYFSPDDFWWLHRNGITIERRFPQVQPRNNPGLMAYDQAQVRELLTNYGAIDMMFFDGEAVGLRDLAWDLQPNLVVTRGAIRTPEQFIPGLPLNEPWEACLTMGTQWQYKPTNEVYKTGGALISLLIETRAKGGNLLLNVGPKPDGELAIEQEERLREIALWMFVNSESIYGVRPWVITNEGDVWFTKRKDDSAVYAIVKTPQRWPLGAWRDLVFKSIRATPETQVTVLGQNDKVLEYSDTVVPKTTWEQKSDGLHVRAMHAQRLYNDRKWPNPVVLKLTHVQPALVPPQVETVAPQWDAAKRTMRLTGRIAALGDATEVGAGFEYCDITGMDLTERIGNWQTTPFTPQKVAGEFTHELTGLVPGHTYEVRAVAKHPLLSLYGQELRLSIP
jgi:alpha-L-fucosidase